MFDVLLLIIPVNRRIPDDVRRNCQKIERSQPSVTRASRSQDFRQH